MSFKKFLSKITLFTLIFGIINPFLFNQVSATSPTTGLNKAPVITSSGSYFVNIGDTSIANIIATDDTENVVMEFGNVTLSGNTSMNISHSEMANPVVVAIARVQNNGDKQRAPRILSKSATGFTFKVDTYTGNVINPINTDVAYLVVDSGAYNIGTMHIQAGSQYTDIVYRKGGSETFNGTSVAFNPSFSGAPIVIHTVATNYDTGWVVSTVNGDDDDRKSQPTATGMSVFLQRSFANNIHSGEVIDYLAIEQGHYNIQGIEIDTKQHKSAVGAKKNKNVSYDISYLSAFPSVPNTFFVSQLGEYGGDGSYAQYTPKGTATETKFPVVVDEDGPNADRGHLKETVGSLVFSTDSGKFTLPNELTFSKDGGADEGKFALSSTGTLTFLTSHDGDNPDDANSDAIYEINVKVCDSHFSQKCSTKLIKVEVDKKPVITLNGSGTIEVIQGEIYTDSGAVCNDEHDGDCSTNITSSGTVNTQIVGTYVIEYDATDSNGNTANTITRTINVVAAPIVINEVEYNPSAEENESEWFELYNPTDNTVDISNWTVTEGNGTSYTITGGTLISSHQYLVITNDKTEFQVEHSSITPDLEMDPGGAGLLKLNNGGDELILKDNLGNEIDYVKWEDYAEAGNGKSICRDGDSTDTDSASDWNNECSPTPQARNVLNNPPTDITLSGTTIDENNNSGALIGTLTTTDPDSGDTHTYSFTGVGNDNASFTLSGAELLAGEVFDYETQSGYTIRILTDDQNGGTFEKEFTITINDLNASPTDITLSGTTIDENNSIGDVIGTLSGSDDGEDSNALTYGLTCATSGTDDGSFTISGTLLKANTVFNYESKSSYDICIQVSDGTKTYDENFTITINDVNESPTDITLSGTTIDENNNSGALIGTLTTTDPDSSDTHTYSFTGAGNDNASFTLSGAELLAGEVFDYETQSGYTIRILTDDQNGGTFEKEFTIIINDLDEIAPTITITGDNPQTILLNTNFTDSGATWEDNVDGTGTIFQANSGSVDTSHTGTYILEYSYTDQAGNTGTGTRTVEVVTGDTPVITLIGSGVVEIEVGTNYTDSGAVYSDTEDGTGTLTASGNVNTNVVGEYTLTYDYTDAQGNKAEQKTRIVKVVDTQAPTITIIGDNPQTILLNTNFTDSGATWEDNVDGTGTLSQASSGSIDTSHTGTYILEYSYTDQAGNTGTAVRTVNVIDGETPIITLIGDSVVEIEIGTTYTDSGAIYSDTEDGTGTLTASGNVNTNVVGEYTLTYDYTDSQGNQAIQVKRIVKVVDSEAPTITFEDDVENSANQSDTINIKVTDNVGVDSGSLEYGFSDDNTCDASDTYGNSFTNEQDFTIDTESNNGKYICAKAEDTSGNIIYKSSEYKLNIDITAPTITIKGDNPQTILLNSNFIDSGATWEDNVDGTGTISQASSGSVDITQTGTYILEYSYTDQAGNTGTGIRTVNVIDGEIPIITLIGDSVVEIEIGTTYTDSGAIYSDTEDGTGSVTASGNVDTNTLGEYTLTYDYTDSQGNQAIQVKRVVKVVDTTSPESPSITSTDNNELFNIGSLTVIGTGEVGTIITLTDENGAVIGTGVVDNNGEYSIDIDLIDGDHTINAISTDSSGNESEETSVNIVVDTTSPEIVENSLDVEVTETQATITWETNEPTSSQIVYGLTVTTDKTTGEQDISPRITSHSLTLTGLTSCTKYYYKTISRDEAGNETIDGIYDFLTKGCTGNAEVEGVETTEIIPTENGTTSSGELSLGIGSKLLNLEVPAGYFDNGTGSCAGTGVYFQLKEIEKEPVINTIGTPLIKIKTLRTYDLSAYCSPEEKVHTFDKKLKVTMSYADEDVEGLDETKLEIYRYVNTWEALDDCSVDTGNNIVTCYTDHFTTFGLFTKEVVITTDSTDSNSTSNSSGGGNTYIPTCKLEDLVCTKKANGTEVYYRKPGAYCEGGDLGKTCSIEEELQEEENLEETELLDKNIDIIEKEVKVGDRLVKYKVKNISSCKKIPRILQTLKDIDDKNIDIYSLTKLKDLDKTKYSKEIFSLESVGVIHGDENRYFNSDLEITRAEFLAILLDSHCYDINKADLSKLKFPDVDKTTWQAKVIQRAYEIGILHGYADGTARPNDIISKAEALGLLFSLNILEVTDGKVDETSYKDLEEKWQEELGINLESLGVVNPKEDNYEFNPNSGVDREFLVHYLIEIIKLY